MLTAADRLRPTARRASTRSQAFAPVRLGPPLASWPRRACPRGSAPRTPGAPGEQDLQGQALGKLLLQQVGPAFSSSHCPAARGGASPAHGHPGCSCLAGVLASSPPSCSTSMSLLFPLSASPRIQAAGNPGRVPDTWRRNREILIRPERDPPPTGQKGEGAAARGRRGTDWGVQTEEGSERLQCSFGKDAQPLDLKVQCDSFTATDLRDSEVLVMVSHATVGVVIKILKKEWA